MLSVMGEFLVSRPQLGESAVLENPDNPSFEGARFFLGVPKRSYVANEFGKEAAILKEKRKAREARPGKGAGKTGGDK